MELPKTYPPFLLMTRMKYLEVPPDEKTFLPCLILSEHTFLLLDCFLFVVIDPNNDLQRTIFTFIIISAIFPRSSFVLHSLLPLLIVLL